VYDNESCTDFFNGETEDYTISVTPLMPMAYVSSTTTQNNLDPVQLGTLDAEIMRINIVASGSLSPFDVTSFDINPNGSTNYSGDVISAKIYYTGNDPNFNTGNLF